jgi:cytoskeletal protein RodZ
MNGRKPLFIGAAVVAVLVSVAAIGVPAGWYSTKKAPAAVETVNQPVQPQTAQTETPAQPQPAATETSAPGEDAAEQAKRQREKERRAREAKAAETNAAATTPTAPAAEAVKPGAKRVVVTVTYDESGRVTQASGGDPNALRIARQKRFPAGKAGSATISIPIN